MPKYLVEMDGKKFQLEGDHAPSEEEARQAIGGSLGSPTQESSASPSQIDLSQFEEKPSPLNAGQNVMLGLMPNEESKLAYLQQEFQGRDVKINEQGLTVDEAPVNPSGPDFGDILRSLGYAPTFAGQVAGSLAGGTAGSSAGPVGTVAGAFTGGVAGATAGEAARIGTGKFLLSALGKNLNLSNEGQTFINSLGEAAGAAAVGETLGVGMVGAGVGLKALSKTQYYKGAADAWSKTVNKLKESNAPLQSALKFVGAIPEDATRVVMRDKPSVVLAEKYFDPDKTSKIASNTLFGTEDFYSLGATNSNGITKGSAQLVKSIKDVNDPSYDQLLQSLGVDKDFIDGIRKSNIDNVLDKTNTNNPRRGFELASRSIKDISKQEEILGKEVGKAESKAIREKSSVYFNGEDLAKKIDSIIGGGSLLKATKIPGYKVKPAMQIPGADQLKELSTVLKGYKQTVNKEGVTITEKKATPYGNIPPKQLLSIKKQFDAKVDGIFNNERIPSEIRGQVKDIAKQFRSRYYDYLGIGEEASAYKQFKDLTDGIKLEGRNALTSLENKISNFKSITGSEQDEFIQAMKTTKDGSKILQEINEFNLAKGIKNINPESMLKSLSAPIGSKKFLSSNTTDTATEGILRSISDRMGAIEGSLASKRQFTQEAERALAAKGFLGSNQNLLRLQTLAGMTGLGGLLSFGPAGAIGGATLALTLANPTNLGKILISAEKNALKPKGNVSRFSKSFKMDDNKKAILKALISSKTRDSENKNKSSK